MSQWVLMSAKEHGHTLIHIPKLSDNHTCFILLVFLNSLLASFLTFWHLSTTDHVTIESLPSQVAEGENVLFLVQNLPENLTAFAWFKGLRCMK